MWSDIVLNAERQHVAHLLLWSALSIISGTAVLTLLVARRIRSPLLQHFSIQMLVWGVAIACIAFFGWHELRLRDVSGAARLERTIWLNIGLDAGYVGIGATLAIVGHMLGRRMALVGAGTAVAIQGIALFLLDVQFAVLVSR